MQTVAEIPTMHNGQTPVMPHGTALLPEAACSINGRFFITGYSDSFQVTGRGASPQEAARNLKGTMDATREALAPTPLAPREERLALLVARGTQKALAARDYPRLERLTKAYILVVRGFVEEVIFDDKPQGIWKVHSQQDPIHTTYSVQGRTCDCPDARRHAEDTHYFCKHSTAVCLLRTVEKQEQEHGAAL